MKVRVREHSSRRKRERERAVCAQDGNMIAALLRDARRALDTIAISVIGPAIASLSALYMCMLNVAGNTSVNCA